MRCFYALWLAITAPVALVACGNGCPEITAWRGATTTPDGALVCARIYGDTSCSGFPLQLAINASDADLHSDLASLQATQSPLTALIRPGCRLHLWNESNFTGEQRSSSSYQWEFDASGVLSARCDCESDNVELLRCEPLVEMVKIQECDYQNSLVGGICPYSVHLQPFRNDNWTIHELPSLTGDPVTEDEVSAIKTMFPLHLDGYLQNPADDVEERLVRHVAPRHKLVVKQISTYTASRSEAVADCNARGFVLASFSQKADANFAARLITSLYSMGWSPFLSYWTAAGLEQFQTYGQDGGYDPKCRLVWPNATPKEDIAFRCSGEEQSVIGRPTINGTWSYEAAYDHDSNHFICEMLL